ncbi:glycosyltransferase family 2 protein [Nodosilinea sp. LEGE 07298]|uniref:glycosyltransferase family 2 protein n=1 Tax=Nodosilinea sp. LEGE 07298 TaxID=2777970 RepID=UPI00188115C7|nr:glycosyltransferase family 2 protein [Nodosilinea sp. LEGE 07298]MBE9112106.1 glycosyltransferase family 2 protein [Nodosilinea sp. LEGE 07298]
MIFASSRAAVLLLIFNRLDTTKQVLEAIRAARPPRFYIACDGPRNTHAGEAETVQAVQDHVIHNIDWKCEIKTLFRDKNLGCKTAVESAINWFFKHEVMGIILEDDCLPSPSFFPYCEELLSRYLDDERIMAISGDNFQFGHQRTQDSYYFSRYPHCWGWATWRRAWHQYDKGMKLWPEIRDQKLLNDILDNRWASRYWQNKFEKTYAGKINSWAFCWTLACWLQSGLTILPNVNLVSNLGFSAGGTHLSNRKDHFANLPRQTMAFPLQHPSYIVRNQKADDFTQRTMFGLRARAIGKTKRLLGF